MDRSAFSGTVFICLAALMFGTVPYFAKSLIEGGMTAPAVAFWRFALTGIAFAPFVWAARAERVAIAWAVSAGVALGLGWIGYASALASLPVATAGVIYMTYPLFTVALGWAWFGYPPTARAVLAALLVVGGAAVSSASGPVTLADAPAMALALTAPLGFAYGIAVLTMKLSALSVLPRMASVQLGAALALLPLAGASWQTILPSTPSGWWLVAGAAVVTALIPQIMYTIWAPRIGATRTAVAGSVELPTMFLVGLLAFSEPLGPGQWAACAMILAALFLAPARPSRGGSPNQDITG